MVKKRVPIPINPIFSSTQEDKDYKKQERKEFLDKNLLPIGIIGALGAAGIGAAIQLDKNLKKKKKQKDNLRSSKDKKFLGHTDHTNK